jgi:hypothetical protein
MMLKNVGEIKRRFNHHPGIQYGSPTNAVQANGKSAPIQKGSTRIELVTHLV